MKKLLFLLLICVLLLTLITGCLDRAELEEKSIVAGMGFDLVDNLIEISFQIILPQSMKGGQSGTPEETVDVVTTKGETGFEALNDLSSKTGKEGLFSHNQVIIFGEEGAKNGVDIFVDLLDRNEEIRRRNFILVAKGDAKEIISAKQKYETIPAFGISQMVRRSYETGNIPAVTLHDFLRKIESETLRPYACGIELVKEKGPDGKESEVLKVSETGIFKNKKLAGWLNDQETKGLLWITGQFHAGNIDIPSVKKGERPIAIEIIRASSKVEANFEDDNLQMIIKVRNEGNIAGQPLGVDLTKPETIKKLEKLTNEQIRDEIQAALKKVQEINSDVFGFADIIYRSHPDRWQKMKSQWDEIFPQLEVKIEVRSIIERFGLKLKSVD